MNNEKLEFTPGHKNWLNRWSPWIVFGLLLLMFLQAFFSSAGTEWLGGHQPPESGTVDEIAHIPGGYAELRFADYRLNPEHPPLVKDLAALPLLFVPNIKFPTDLYNWQSEPNGQWETGWKFIYERGNNPERIFLLMRLGPMLLIFLLGYFLFRWTKELFGVGAGLFAVFLFAFAPDFIAQARYVTTDVGITTFIFIFVYCLVKFIRQPSWKTLLWTALALALASLTKFSAIVLLPYLVLTLLVAMAARFPPVRDWLGTRRWRSARGKRFWVYLVGGILIIVIGHVFIFAPYFHHTYNTPDDVYQRLVDDAFMTPDRKITDAPLPLALRSVIMRLASWPGGKAPATYLLGVVNVFGNDINGRNSAYIMGHYGETGWWFYYFLAFLFKMPIPILIFTLLALGVGLIVVRRDWRRIRAGTAPGQNELAPQTISWWTGISQRLGHRFEIVAMVILVAIFWISGMLNQTNIGLRWMMPTFPFIFLVIAGASRWLCRRLARPNASARGTSRKTIGAGVALVLCGWLVAGTTATYPHYLAYFNELIGERTNAYKYLIDSNLDWGQDLNWLRAWMDQSGVDHVYLDYLGGGVPAHSLGDGNFTAWHSIDGLPPEESYLAISATFYQLSEFYARDHNEVSYVRMLDREPDAQVGYSLLVYKITADDRAQFLTSEQAEARAREYLNLSDDMQASDCRRVVVNEWSRSSFLPIPKKFKRPAYAVTFAAEPKPTVYVDYLTGEVWGGYQAD